MVGTWALNLFDRLHIGHKVMIDRLSEMPDPVACVTDGELVGPGLELSAIIQPVEHRLRKLEKYIHNIGLDQVIKTKAFNKNNDLMSIDGSTTFLMYKGPCCTVIETGPLNFRKKELSVNDFVEQLKPVRTKDGGKVSSARIRRGEIDSQGRRLKGTDEPPRFLQVDERASLKTPKGDVYAAKDRKPEERVVQRIKDESPIKVIAVGDMTSDTILREGYAPDVMIVDGITKRGPYGKQFSASQEFTIYNPAAVIYPEAWSAVNTAIHDPEKSLIIVDGEEDLIGFPAVLLAPNDSAVLYGQPDVGIVWIPVNEENKKIARNLLNNMPIIK